MRNITRIEEHLYEGKNHEVGIQYMVFDGMVYEIKSKSQLTKAEREFPKTQIFHF